MGPRLVLATLVLMLAGSTLGLDYADSYDSFEYVQPQPYASCNDGEVVCSSDCAALRLCTGGGQYVNVATCPDGTLCDYASKSCKTATDVVCLVPPDETMYTCHDTGRFPNPYDCHSYFDCGSSIPTTPVNEIECDPSGNAYDALLGYCSLSSTSRPCVEGPIPKCTKQGDSGPVPENPNIYYYCFMDTTSGTSLVPWMLRCKNPSYVFDNGACRPAGDGNTTTTETNTSTTTGATTTTETNTSTTTGPTTTTTTTKATTTPYPCQEANTSHIDPDDCHSFYICLDNLQPVHRTCKTGYRFDVNLGYCVKGDC